MKRKGLFKLAGAVCLAAVIAIPLTVGCAAPAPTPTPEEEAAPKVVEWTFQSHVTPGDAGWYNGQIPWIKMVEEATKGTVRITYLPVGSIASEAETVGAVSAGTIDGCSACATSYGGEIPEGFLAYGLARATETPEDVWELMWGPKYRMGDLLKEAFAKHNLEWKGHFSQWNNMGFGDFPVYKWEDYKGIKMRAGGPQAAYLGALDGVPIAVPWGDIYMSMKLGTIEGFFADLASFEGMKFNEVTKWLHFPAWCPQQHNEMFINKDSWNQLEQWQKDAIDSIFEELYFTGSYMHRNVASRCLLVADEWDCQRSVMSDEEVVRLNKRVAENVWPEVAKLAPLNAQGIEIAMRFLTDKGRL